MNLEAEVTRLRQDYQSCQAVQQKILKGMDEINKKINHTRLQPDADLSSISKAVSVKFAEVDLVSV